MIQLDLLYYNKSNIILLLILSCLTKNIICTFIILIFYNIINKFNKINIEHENYNNYNIIKIYNKYKTQTTIYKMLEASIITALNI